MASVALPGLFGFPGSLEAVKKGMRHGPNLNQIIGELAPERQERIEARYQELKQNVETVIVDQVRSRLYGQTSWVYDKSSWEELAKLLQRYR